MSSIKLLKCPYNPKHEMPQQSFHTHLFKCKSQNKHLFKTCQYNPHHVILKTDIEDHQQKCNSKKKFQKKQSDDDWGVEQYQSKKDECLKKMDKLGISVENFGDEEQIRVGTDNQQSNKKIQLEDFEIQIVDF